ncbi:response regulator transcription factor [Flavobacterium sp. DG1-102-2]|uniref:response regulator transcription factor n=1 Tax=Flavobacterium sp. DG1-102-2 TaxID=3081663 RepID=UPI0029490F75|nr:response regulator transcription factor [Flavobacterium sp. DG1-102-2]MDV6167875.1 response regulator transcription factor [Flavobacterium sp. DG1-102-2]
MNEIRVLYAEDELALGRITGDMLVKNGFNVKWVHDGTAALEAFSPGSFDICVIDVMMPGIDGYSLVKEIRKADADIPVIFLTARSLIEDVVKGFETGGNDYLKKPFSIEELIVRMNALLKRTAKPIVSDEAQVSKFSIGKFKFDYSTMELACADKTIVLTNLENELLLRLITNKNAVLPRQRVLLELWGDDTFFAARSMDVFITKLRKHFADDERISIVNIRGVGYKMIVKD